jgi:hypothetical protein
MNRAAAYQPQLFTGNKTTVFPAITLYQPWATWIIRGWKDIETRTHDRFKSLVGKWVLIHAGMSTDGSDLTRMNPYLTRDQIMKDPDEMVNGAILGMAFVYRSCKLTGESSHRALINCQSTIRYGLFLEGIEKFPEPIYCKGEMGIWYFDLAKKQKVKKAGIQPA